MDSRAATKRFAVVIFLIVALAAGTARSGTIMGSDHDLTSLKPPKLTRQHPGQFYNDYADACVYCHTPHGANPAVPLWNRLTNQGNYTLYSSSTLNATMEQPALGGVTRLCLSCHDGTIAVDTLVNYPNKTYTVSTSHYKMAKTDNPHGGSCGFCHMWFYENPPARDVKPSFMTTSLADDHPVSFVYNDSLAQADGTLESPSSTPSGLGGTIRQDMLVNDRIECSSCHDVHNPDIFPFLIKSNDNSALCYTCHIR